MCSLPEVIDGLFTKMVLEPGDRDKINRQETREQKVCMLLFVVDRKNCVEKLRDVLHSTEQPELAELLTFPY